MTKFMIEDEGRNTFAKYQENAVGRDNDRIGHIVKGSLIHKVYCK